MIRMCTVGWRRIFCTGCVSLTVRIDCWLKGRREQERGVACCAVGCGLVMGFGFCVCSSDH
jgi:hypothetical protein